MWAWHGSAAGLLSEEFWRNPHRADQFTFTVRLNMKGTTQQPQLPSHMRQWK